MSIVEPVGPGPAPTIEAATIEAAAVRLAALLVGHSHEMSDANPNSDLVFEPALAPRPLARAEQAPDAVWAVDGGQCLVADARCVQVLAVRASRVLFQQGRCQLEEEGDLSVHVVGTTEARQAALATLGLDLPPDTAVDVNLLRDRAEWAAIERTVDEAEPGSLVLVDGDLQPDWRVPSTWLSALLERAASRNVLLAGVTKRSSLSRGGAPLLGQLEIEAEATAGLGRRAMWWVPVARSRAATRPDLGRGIQVVVARLDPDARYAFRIDLPADADAERALGSIAAVADDAAFPGYPYPLTVADRLAACPGWLRAEAWLQLDELLDRAGVPLEVRERAFDDRHRLMERA